MAFDPQPTLHGELATLRPLQAADFTALAAAAADPLIWEQHPVKDRCTPAGFRQFFDDALASGGALVILNRADGSMIGSSRYHGFDAADSSIEIGWTFLARAHWGGKVNGEVKRLMMQHAFGSVKSVLFLVGPDNMRSQRAVEKIGGVLVGTRPDDTGLISNVFAVTRERFNSHHA